MKINRIHLLFLEDLRRQHFQDKNNLKVFEMFRQELVTIQATGDHLSDALIPEALADFPQSGEGRFRIAQPDRPDQSNNREQARPACAAGGSRCSGPCGPVPAGLRPDRIPARRPYPQFGNRKRGIHVRLLQTCGRRPVSCGPGRGPDPVSPVGALPQKKRRMETDRGDKPHRTDGRRCSKKRPPDTPGESGRACRTPPERGRRPYRPRSRDKGP